jgi:hypothetical protein
MPERKPDNQKVAEMRALVNLLATMDTRPHAVVSAVDRLRRSETVPDHEQRARQIKAAFDMLNAYLSENPGSEHREYIENCKQAHMRSHLKQLSVLVEPDQETWFMNFALFGISWQEVSRVLQEHPELQSWYNSFINSYQKWATIKVLPPTFWTTF